MITQEIYILYLFSVILGVVLYTGLKMFAKIFDW
jgi:hypothetical protein